MEIKTAFNLHQQVNILVDGEPIAGDIIHISVHIDENPSIAYWVNINHPHINSKHSQNKNYYNGTKQILRPRNVVHI